jgi:hypothetical protein
MQSSRRSGESGRELSSDATRPGPRGEWEGSVGAFTYGKRAGSYVVPAKKHWFGLQVGEVNEDDGVTA